ncbi:MAG TPA: cellulase family glycosylhydrolase [Verrucomicrobiae bacterium]|nr:cellulase family glycosylhydrolase [Verrucomicrobiae bacterium]
MRTLLPITIATLMAALALGRAAPIDGIVNTDGNLRLMAGSEELADFRIGAFDTGWQWAGAAPDRTALRPDAPAHSHAFAIRMPNCPKIAVESLMATSGDTVVARYAFAPGAEVTLNSLHVSMDLPASAIGGGKWKVTGADGAKGGSFPIAIGNGGLFSGDVSSLEIATAKGATLRLVFKEPTRVLIQDNRQWQDPSFSVRMGRQGQGFRIAQGQRNELGFTLSSSSGIRLERDTPITLAAGPEWIPLKTELDIESGSAADFSGQGFHDAPAGKHGRVIASPQGHFVFEKDPKKTPRRFYGVNFSFGSQYMDHPEADRMADRLQRLGYNAIRVHHYEMDLIAGQTDSVTPDPEKFDRLDYFIAACAQRGIYVTTDLFVSRPIPWKEIGIEKPDNVEMDTFKILIPVVPRAWENWKAFARNFLTHTNPYRKTRYADDPALAWLSMVNEGTYGNFLGKLRDIPEWQTAWNAWLAKRYPGAGALRSAWGKELRDGEDPALGKVAFPDGLDSANPRAGDCIQFLAEMERDTLARMRAFLRDELGCRALLTNANAWTNFLAMQAARNVFDYVDDHFYVDHPVFIERPWQLPSRCDNRSPILGGAAGGRANAFTRVPGKPFTITEYNYAAPGRFRGVGGILTGALGALQDWDGIWRYSYSHTREGLLRPSALNYFDMATDPLGQAAERASLCLFLRGDMKSAHGTVAFVATEDEALSLRPQKRITPPWSWLAWIMRVGTIAAQDPRCIPAESIPLPIGDASLRFLGTRAAATTPAYELKDADIALLLRSKGAPQNGDFTDPAKRQFQCPTGEITIDGQNDVLTIDTPRTAGGYAPTGKTISSLGGALQITIGGSDATVWINSLDGKPIRESARLLLSHLTDLQNSGIRYGEKSRQTLLAWGALPHLIRNGNAAVTLKHTSSANLKVWALSNGGRRLAEIPTTLDGATLAFTADVAALAPKHGAIMLYEIAAQ